MRKRLLSSLLALCMVLTLLPATAWAGAHLDTDEVVPVTGGNIYIRDNVVVDADESITAAVIPDYVTSIGWDAFYRCESLTSITIPDSVTSIGRDAFGLCTSLKSITIPDSVTSIDESAFIACESLTSIDIPNGVTSIGFSMFYRCENLTSITIPDSVTSIGHMAFDSCTSLTSITIPNSVTSIGDFAFFYCESLTSITIPDSVTSIGDSAFSDCTSLTSITIPDSVTSIGDSAFSGCTSLTNISVGTNNQNYTSEDGALFNKNKTTLKKYPEGKSEVSYDIPDSVTYIENYAFNGCTSLKNITIPDSVTYINDIIYAFNDCTSLTSISVSTNNQNYSSEDGILFDKKKEILIRYPEGKSEASYVIPDRVIKIADYAFSGCEGLTSITIPNYITSIGWNAFSRCTNLKTVTILKGVTTIDNYAFYRCENLTSITIPNGITSIGNSAFSNCNSLTSIAIPNSVTEIDDSAFYNCSSLTSITIPNGVTKISASTFGGCKNLASVTIPDSVTTIGERAFSGCQHLKDIYYIGTEAQWARVSIGSAGTLSSNVIIHFNSSDDHDSGSDSGTDSGNADDLPEDSLEDYNVASTVQWSYPTITDGTVTQDTYSGKIQVLIFFRANGRCGNSNGTIESLADVDWIKSDNIQVIAVGWGESNEDAQTVKAHVTEYKKRYAPNCEDIEFCYGTNAQGWSTIGQLQSLIKGNSSRITYAVNYIFDSENYLRFTWQGGYRNTYYTSALDRLGGNLNSGAYQGTYQIKLDGIYDYESAYAVLDNLNSYREEQGLSQLVMDEDLLAVAMQRAAETAIYYSHTRPDGSSCFSIFPSKFLYGTNRENVAIGYSSTDGVMNGWKNSSGHNANILANSNSSVGIGVFVDNNGTRYWVQLFSSVQGTAEASRSSGTRTVTTDVSASAEMLNISVSPDSAVLEIGETITLTASNNNGWTFAIPKRTMIYLTYAESQAPNIATVSIGNDGKAVVTAVSSGITRLELGLKATGTSESIIVYVPVTVRASIGGNTGGTIGGNTGGTTDDNTGGTTDNNTNGNTTPNDPTISNESTTTPSASVYTDVPAGAWYAEAVKTMQERNLMSGTGDGMFSPEMKMSRAMLVTVLHRLANTPSGGTLTFTDVPSGEWYSDAVAWASANGIVTGTNMGFDPNGDMTREQLATILYRYAKTAGISTSASGDLARFSDNGTTSDWASEAMRWAVGAGIIGGTDTGLLMPTGSATRAEVATMLTRFIALTK